MYHKASISPLSNTQISKILNGHSVRVSPGNTHDIELSKEQLKKFAKAHQNGKAMTLTLDPFQIQNLRGSGNLKRTSKSNAKRLITSATDRAIRALEGSGYMQDAQVRLSQKDALRAERRYGPGDGSVTYKDVEDDEYYGYGIGGNITKVAKTVGKAVIQSSGNRAIRAIDGSGVNRLKKAQRWEQFSNATIRDGIDTAGKAARVYYDSSNPMAQMGFGIGGNITKVAKTVGKAVIQSSGNRAIRAIDGSGVNRLKKAQRWEQFAMLQYVMELTQQVKRLAYIMIVAIQWLKWVLV
jgi:hypothetical protein